MARQHGPRGVASLSVDSVTALLISFCKGQNYAFKEGRWLAYLAGECGPNGGKVKN